MEGPCTGTSRKGVHLGRVQVQIRKRIVKAQGKEASRKEGP